MPQAKSEFATIETKEAVVFWKEENSRVACHGERLLLHVGRALWAGGVEPWGDDNYSDYGAHEMDFRKLSEAKRVRILQEMCLEFVATYDCDPTQVIREFCKINGFYGEGARSFPMRRLISYALYGRAREDWPPFSGIRSHL